MKSLYDYEDNCALMAVHAVAHNIASEAAIINAFIVMGWRESGGGIFRKDWLEAARHIGLSLGPQKIPRQHSTMRGMTLDELRAKFKKGTYLISVKGHALCMFDGQIWDQSQFDKGTRRRVVEYCEVLNPAPKPDFKYVKAIRRRRAKGKALKRWMTAQRVFERFSPFVDKQKLLEYSDYTQEDWTDDLNRGYILFHRSKNVIAVSPHTGRVSNAVRMD